MARIIPSFLDERTPQGERDVFTMLATGPDNWTVMHSLDLAPWNRGMRTEIDFVIIAPETGILCIEVKSHDNLFFDGFRWYPETIRRSPFKQALDGRYTLTRGIRELAPILKHVPIVNCCIFPRSPFDLHANLSVQPWELMDMRGFRSFSSGSALCCDLKHRIELGIAADQQLEPLRKKLTADQIDMIIKLCLPIQKCRPEASEEITRRTEHVEQLLRQQQKPVLELAKHNPRLIVSGGAGTGKTLIAMELARRGAEAGQRVGLLCFNKLVGEWMAKRTHSASPPRPNLVVGRAIQVMAKMTDSTIPQEASSGFWETELTATIEERLTDSDFNAEAKFDFIIIDEAQDILARQKVWECLSQFLIGGWSQGKFVLLGDFENQVLADRQTMNENLANLRSVAVPTNWQLTENCRNYRIVGETALSLGGLGRDVYSGYMRLGGGIQNYDIEFYETDDSQVHTVSRWLQEFKAQGYKPSEISILSFRKYDLSAAKLLKYAGFKLKECWQEGELTSFATVHGYKGMENKVIILIDVSFVESPVERDLFYTGLTRATETVRVLCNKNSQRLLTDWIISNSP